MAGNNHHHIPRFLQRGFAVAGSGENKIWRFDKERLPNKPRSIRSTGSEDFFYTPELDDEITAQEKSISTKLIALRAEAVGMIVSPELAAELVGHLAPRAAHLRQTIERGMRHLAQNASDLLTHREALGALLGFNQAEPNSVFRMRFEEELRSNEVIASLGFPAHMIERLAFYLGKEQFNTVAGTVLPTIRALFAGLSSQAPTLARTGHNKALARSDGPSVRNEFLRTLEWRLVAAPAEGAILPDCVAYSIKSEGTPEPLMLAGLERVHAVVMPLSRHVILLGTAAGYALPEPFDLNQAAARVSHRFFLAATKDEAIAALHSLIDQQTSHLIDDAVFDAFKDLAPRQTAEEPAPDGSPSRAEAPVASQPSQYELSFLNCADGEVTAQMAEAVTSLVNALASALPLGTLNGITFAADYPAALRDLDRGPGIAPATTIDASIGTGIAQTVTIMRDGISKSRVVVDASVAHYLISEDARDSDWATGILVRQLMLVALNDIIDTALPGVMLQPISDPLQGWLYSVQCGAADGYIASDMSAGFGEPDEVAEGHRQLLAEALDRMRTTILSARLEYRYHGDLDVLLNLATPCIRHVLLFAANLLGHCHGLDCAPVEPGSELEQALEAAGLAAWLPSYAEDLERIRQRLGRWDSFDEFLALNVHVERLMWQHGMLPWMQEDTIRVEIPIATDAQALMEAMADQNADSGDSALN